MLTDCPLTQDTIGVTEHNHGKRRRQDKLLAKGAAIDEELDHQMAVVEQAIETSVGQQREHYRALLRRLRQVRDMQPDI